jgi:hypothetical protein
MKKRTGMFVSVLFLLGSFPAFLPAASVATAIEHTSDSELPWSTVQAVLKKVAEQGHYSYSDLVAGYNVGTVSVEQQGSGYVVKVFSADGLLDVILIEIG